MVLYHGTTKIIYEVDLTKGRHRTDFGQGFYLGNDLGVRGPIANDKVNFVVEDYMKDRVTAEEAIAQVKALPNVLQISLHTPHTLTYLAVDV